MVMPSRGTATKIEKADPACRWQCLQWHVPVISGGQLVV
jgi:hypothetical protein